MRSASDRTLAAGIAAALLLRGTSAGAESAGVDPTYGRIDGDIAVVVGAGAVVSSRNARAAVEARLRYLETAGWFVTYEDAPIVSAHSAPERLLSTGLELRPLFLFRWLQGHELARPLLDLTLDSIGLELGAAFGQSSGSDFSSRPGLEAGLGLEVPLSGGANGAWLGLHGGMRWSSDALSSGVVATAEDRAAYLAITLSWHQLVRAHVVDPGNRAPL